jgi:hypothetical protein
MNCGVILTIAPNILANPFNVYRFYRTYFVAAKTTYAAAVIYQYLGVVSFTAETHRARGAYTGTVAAPDANIMADYRSRGE